MKLQNILTGSITAFAAVALAIVPASAAEQVALDPWKYSPENVCDVVAELQSADSVRLEKNCETSANAAAGAELTNVAGLSTTGLNLSYDYEDYCGAGAPRFNVYLENGQTIFLGCAYGDEDNDGTTTFVAGETYGGVLFPEDEVVVGIDLVLDEEGQVTISNIQVNGVVVSTEPSSKNACKNGGYANLTDANGSIFRNQGQCVSYYNHLN